MSDDVKTLKRLLAAALHKGVILSHNFSPLGPHSANGVITDFKTCMRGTCPEWRAAVLEAKEALS